MKVAEENAGEPGTLGRREVCQSITHYRTILLREVSWGKLVKFMVPVLGALILQAMWRPVDLLVVGQFGTDARYLGGGDGEQHHQSELHL